MQLCANGEILIVSLISQPKRIGAFSYARYTQAAIEWPLLSNRNTLVAIFSNISNFTLCEVTRELHAPSSV